MKLSTLLIVIVLMVAVGAGVGMIPKFLKNSKSSTSSTSTTASGSNVKSAGVADKSTFKDSAEGVLKEGGIDGEGNFHLERPGGASQNVYLTSTTVDLTQFVGKKVKVLGQTFSSEKAGWLMDVGYIETQ